LKPARQTEAEAGIAEASWRWGMDTPDDAILERVRAGEAAPYEVLMRRYNSRLRSMARRVLWNEADVEEAMQEAHYNAFRFIRQFSGRSSFSTWLTRIVFHAALGRLRHRAHLHEVAPITPGGKPLEAFASAQRDPEQQLQDKERREALETAVGELPESYRTPFLLRMVGELSTAEVAGLLEITDACVKTRLHRAKALLRSRLRARWKPVSTVSVSWL
jgi:RNA polymerase sigma-70 factor, ECF subfamily